MKRLELRGLNEIALEDTCRELGLPRFRANQLFRWVQQKAIQVWPEISNIGPKDLGLLQDRLDLVPLALVREQRSVDGTRKYLFRLQDGQTIECVLMEYQRQASRERQTVCVSTQVGCPVGCAFCATGQLGWRRNLTPGEIVSQVLDVTYQVRPEDPDFHITNIVFMGMGEPLLNYEAVLTAIDLLNNPHGQNIGMRRMTISTSGVAPKIRQLARDNDQVGLAISLHAPTDEERSALVPINRRYPLAELMDACREYTGRTNRRLTFEIAVIAGQVTDRWAEGFAHLLQGQLAHVNLIPVNPVEGTGMRRPSAPELEKFQHILAQAGIPVSVREERGTDIDAACGQLRQRWEEQ